MRKINGKDYIPFDLTNPLHKDYLRQKAWIRNHLGEEHLITGIFGGRFVHTTENVPPEILLRDWTFLNGEPCGVERVDLHEEDVH